MLSRLLLAQSPSAARYQVQGLFSRRGYTVLAANNAIQCLSMLRRAKPDVLILQLDLPWGGGDGVLELMRDGDVPSLPVVLFGQPGSPARHATASPVVHYYPQPVPYEWLLTAAHNIVRPRIELPPATYPLARQTPSRRATA